MDEKQKRKRWTGEEIVAVIRRHLVDKVELSKLCEEAGCCPSQVFRWEKQFFDAGAHVFDRKPAESREIIKFQQRAEELEKKLQQKNEVLAELMIEHVILKKKTGGASGTSGSPTTPGTKSLIS
jgi:transposase-like protein